ncbi:hypothetical protein BC834DRAFT_957799 [Gloeopeniophorella convolvens]|nr:hypothetical protein BC834DRAFT_957799 [Gloeopeniophorella convolvens]
MHRVLLRAPALRAPALRAPAPRLLPPAPLRTYAHAPAPSPVPPTPGPSKPYTHEKAPLPPQSWLTRQLKQSPAALRLFLRVFGAIGYGNTRQVAARRALALYEQLCADRAEEDRAFWADECHLPPTFQSWFTVTNLHVWLLTTRLRALPAPHAQAHIQGLIDHFFYDVEDRVRHVLQPAPQPPAPATRQPFYAASAPPPRKRGRAPEALVTRQMKVLREQWAGLGVALDLALAQDTGGDAALAAAMWRNLLGARGAAGLALALAPASPVPAFRRAVNPGGAAARLSDVARVREEARDDGSGVHDFGPEARDAYVRFPETMLVLAAYVRSEVARLARVPDERVMAAGAEIGKEAEGIEALRFGRIEGARAAVEDLLKA